MRRVHDAERDRKAYAEAMGSTARPHRLRASDGAPQRGMSNAGARPRFLVALPLRSPASIAQWDGWAYACRAEAYAGS